MTRPNLIKDTNLLKETDKTRDLLDFSDISQSLRRRIDESEMNSIIGIVGPYGTGKSTLLYNMSLSSSESEKWIFFDAWKYPDRDHLWEGLLLDYAEQIDCSNKHEIVSIIDGKQFNGLKSLISASFTFLIHPVVGSFVSKFIKGSPAKRVFEKQLIIKDLINQATPSKSVVIVVEDIDRSGDKGEYFLETLRHFLKSADENQTLNKPVMVLVPMGEGRENRSFEKCIDYFYEFNLGSIDYKQFIELALEVPFVKNQDLVIEQLNEMFRELSRVENVSFRKLKRMIREIDQDYRSLSSAKRDKLDLRLVLTLGFIKKLNMGRPNAFQAGLQISQNDYDFLHNQILRIRNHSTQTAGQNGRHPIMFVDEEFYSPFFVEPETPLAMKYRDSVLLLSNDYIRMFEV